MGLVSELRRRNVFRMAALYAAAAWLVMQVVDVVEGKLPLPDWMGSAVLAVLAVGFPIALVISWFYEVTPEGISRDTDEESAESTTGFTGRRVDFVIISVLVAAVLVFAYDKWWTGPPPERSVAVLPFANMSADEDSAYIAVGVADTILNMLAQVPELHVAARTSSFQPRLHDLGAREIGALLGVGAVLEGSVQRQGDRLRITAQLIDAEDDSHLWSRNFDRDYGDVFAIQDEIAEAVTSALELSLQGETKQRIDREGTDNLEAFEEYSKAIDNLRVSTVDSVQRAAEQLQRAIELDPDFARAHAMLGHMYLAYEYTDFRWAELGYGELKGRARDAANTALRIAPGMSTALTLLGHLTEDVDVKGQLFREAVENGPNDTLALRAYASYLFTRKLQVTESTELARKLIRLDPLDDRNHWRLGQQQMMQNQIPAALQTIAQGKEKIPNSNWLRDLESMCYLRLGDYRSAIVAEYETLELNPKDFYNRYEIGLLYLLAGMPSEAERWIRRSADLAPPSNFAHRLNPLLMDIYLQQNDEDVFAALIQFVAEELFVFSPVFGNTMIPFVEYGARLGRLDDVLATFERLTPHLFADPPYDLDSYPSRLYAVGLAMLRHGDVQRGEHLMRAALEILDNREQAGWPVNPASFTGRLALGETDAALAKFREFVARNKWYDAEIVMRFMLRYSSLYDPIGDEPEFIALLDEYDRNAAEQRRWLIEMAHELPVK